MVWKKRIFGPGPERLTNTFLNRLADQVHSNSLVPSLWRPGVLFGCVPLFQPGGVIEITAGAVVSAGQYFELDEDAPQTRTVTVAEAGGTEAVSVWLYVDANGKLAYTIGLPPGWPDHVDPLVEYEPSYCVVGWAVWSSAGWAEPRDVRRFVRCTPNDTILVVGDVNTGADFESLQQALDYLEAADLAKRAVPRHIMVTQDQLDIEPLRVRVPGVRIGARPTGVVDPAGGDVEPSKRIRITWSQATSATHPVTAAQEAALFDLDGQQDFRLEGFHLTREVKGATCVLWNPGHRMQLADCTVDTDSGGSLEWVIGAPDDVVLSRLWIEGNEILGVTKGLIWFAGTYNDVGDELIVASTGCLIHSVIKRNRLEVKASPKDWSKAFKNGLLRDNVYAAIDCGLNDAAALSNTVQANKITGSFVSIRIGRQSKARNNMIEDAALFGVWVARSGLPAMDQDSVVQGGTEVSGNTITMLTDPGEGGAGADLILPWWRSAVRLDLGQCYVLENVIDLNDQSSCGVSDGYVLGLERSASAPAPPTEEPAEMLPPRIVGTERAHGIVVLTEEKAGSEVRITPDTRLESEDGKQFYYPDRRYFLPKDEEEEKNRQLWILVNAEKIGQEGYQEPLAKLLPPDEVKCAAVVGPNGITGIYDIFYDPPSTGHHIKGNEIKGNEIKGNEITQLQGKTALDWLAEPAGDFSYRDAAYVEAVDQVVVGRSDGYLSWLDPPDGSTLEDVLVAEGDSIVGEPAVRGTHVFVCTASGQVRCYDSETYEPVWAETPSTSAGIEVSPTLGKLVSEEESLFVCDEEGTLYCFKPKEGSLNWSYRLDEKLDLRVTGKPCFGKNAFDQDVLIIPTQNPATELGKVYFVNADSPELKVFWTYPEEGEAGPFNSAPAVAANDGEISEYAYIGSDEGKLICFDIGTESRFTDIWSEDFGSPEMIRSSPFIKDKWVYVGKSNNHFYRVSLDGKEILSCETVGNVLSRPFSDGTRVYLGCDAGNVYCRNVGDLSECYTHSIATGGAANSTFNRGPGGPLTTANTGEAYSFLWVEEPSGEAYISPPVDGFGVLLLSRHNRVAGNRITSVCCGIFVLDANKVGENIIYSAWTAIIASRNNAVYGNQIWWYRSYSEEWGLKPANPFFATYEYHPPIMCVMASAQNVIEGNQLISIPYTGPYTLIQAGAAIVLHNIPLGMLGTSVIFPTTSDPEALSVFAISGGNVVRSNTIDLDIDASRIPLKDANPDHMPAGARFAGVISTADLLRPLPTDLLREPFRPGKYFDIAYSAFNEIVANRITRCGYGYLGFSTDVIRDCRIENVIVGLGANGARIEGCHVSQVRIMALSLDGIEADESYHCPSVVTDSVLMLPKDPSEPYADPSGLTGVKAVVVSKGAACIHNCFIANHHGEGIAWAADHGSCVGCYFYTMEPGASWVPDSNINTLRHAAIVFDPGDNTQGNLIAGAHMAHSLARVWLATGSSVGAWDDDIGPIQNAGTNECPPVYASGRWTNRISWASAGPGQAAGHPGTCYHLTVVKSALPP